jgi:hypothetical protein
VRRRSSLSLEFIGLPSTTLYVVVLVAWGVLAFGTLHPGAFAGCAAADVDPHKYRVWIHEGAQATAGATVAGTRWAIYLLPPRNLEAVLAHEQRRPTCRRR